MRLRELPMPKAFGSTYAVVSLGAIVAGCQSAPVRYAHEGVHATYSVAATGATAVRSTGGELYLGAGNAVRRPFHDLNLMQDKIAPVLLRAESHPYDLRGVNSCNDVLDRVAELDLALGPDVDTPKERRHTRVARGADFAATAALDAAGSAAEHFLPMRSTIKQITGAQRYENHVKHAQLAGVTRRSFLKAIGMEHSCVWPAAPLDFAPTQVADVSAPWVGPPATSPAQTGGAPVVLASAAVAPTRATTVQALPAPAGAPSDAAPAAARPILVAQQGSSAQMQQPVPVRTPRAAPARAPQTSSAPLAAHVVLVSAAGASAPRRPVFVPIRDRLAVPSAAPASEADQAWRPAPRAGELVEVSTPVASASTASGGGGGAAAPWSAAFAGAASARP